MGILGDKLRIIAQVTHGSKKVVGYSYISPVNGEVAIDRLEQIAIRAQEGHFSNAKWENGKLVGTECQLSRLPIVDWQTRQVTAQNVVSILEVIRDGEKPVAYTVVDGLGRIGKIPAARMMQIAEKTGIANAKIVAKGGKRFISAIMGEFKQSQISIKPKLTPIKKAEDAKNKQAASTTGGSNTNKSSWVRPIHDARYLGKSTSGGKGTLVRKNIVDVYELYLSTRAAIAQFSKPAANTTYADSIELARVLNAAVCNRKYWGKQVTACKEGRVGKRIRSHYSNMFKEIDKEIVSTRSFSSAIYSLENSGAAKINMASSIFSYYDSADLHSRVDDMEQRRELTSGLLDAVSELRSWVSIESDTILKVLNVYEKFLVDYMNYQREALTKSMGSSLLRAIAGSSASKSYIELNANGMTPSAVIILAIEVASKSRIDGISQIMYVSALELAWMFTSATETPQQMKKRSLKRRIGKVAKLLNQEPKQIESEKDYGAMLFQAVVIAMMA